MAEPEDPSTQSTSPWLGEVTSPYGLSDEDGTLRQADNMKWRTLFGGRKQKRFVAHRAGRSPAPPLQRTGDPVESRTPAAESSPAPRAPSAKGSLSSLMMGQTLLSIATLLAAVYVTRSSSATAVHLDAFLHSAYREDYSRSVVPTIENIIHQLHWMSAGSTPGTAPTTGVSILSRAHRASV